MPVLDSNEIFFTAFEPKQKNRFIMFMDGFPTFMVKKVGEIKVENGEVTLNHINVYRKVKGMTKWSDIAIALYDPITPSGAQAVMEWVRLHHESVTGRDGYSDFYKKDLTFNVLGPVGDIVSEWIIKGAYIKDAAFGEYDWASEGEAQELTMTVTPDYCVLNF